jgi:hypothetical protein
VVRDRAVHRKATVRTNREWHDGLAGWRIVGKERANHKAGRGEMVVLIVGVCRLSRVAQTEGYSVFGVHSRANCCASAIWAGVKTVDHPSFNLEEFR